MNAPMSGALKKPKILFVRSTCEDYLADSLLHGLRSVLGVNVVDIPKAEFVYNSYPESLRRTLYGRGFSLYGDLQDETVDRTRIEDRLRAGEFDILIFADLNRTSTELIRYTSLAKHALVVLVDGADSSELYPQPSLLRADPLKILAALRIAGAGDRWRYFKREWSSSPRRLRTRLTAWLNPSTISTHPIAFSIPESKVRDATALSAIPKRKEFPSHIVDVEVAAHLGAQTKYAFENEAAYYDDLASSRFGITTKRAGWDCMRHYEIAANGAVPCFRDLHLKESTCAPHGLNETNTISYTDVRDLIAKTTRLSDDAYATLRMGAMQWARDNTTRRRAEQFLNALGFSVSDAQGP